MTACSTAKVSRRCSLLSPIIFATLNLIKWPNLSRPVYWSRPRSHKVLQIIFCYMWCVISSIFLFTALVLIRFSLSGLKSNLRSSSVMTSDCVLLILVSGHYWYFTSEEIVNVVAFYFKYTTDNACRFVLLSRAIELTWLGHGLGFGLTMFLSHWQASAFRDLLLVLNRFSSTDINKQILYEIIQY